jgi:hypothetical protein
MAVVGFVLAATARSAERVLGLVSWGILRLGKRASVRRPLVIAAVVAVVGFVPVVAGVNASRGATDTRSGSGNPFAGISDTATVYLIPLDAHARTLLAQTSPNLRRWLPPSVQVHVIPASRSSWADKNRNGEWNGLKVAKDLLAAFKAAQGGRQVFLMAVTSQAIFDPATPQFSFVFGLLWWQKPQFAAVFGTRPMYVFQPERERTRLTKMMLRYIGEVVCNLPRNANPRSVLYQPILGTPDLDRMVATLPASCRR